VKLSDQKEVSQPDLNDMEGCLFVREVTKIRQKDGKPKEYFSAGQPLANGLEVILIILFPTWREMGSEAGSQAVSILKEFMYIHTIRTYATHLLEDGMDIITLKDLLIHQI
jgi:hypothetical protein